MASTPAHHTSSEGSSEQQETGLSNQRETGGSDQDESEHLDSQIFVLFGATGDLARRELFPALHTLAVRGYLPQNFRLIGTGRHEPDGGDFEALIRDSLGEFVENIDDDAVATLLHDASFVVSDDDNGDQLRQEIQSAQDSAGEDARVMVYLSIPPAAMEGVIRMLEDIGVARHARLVIEKPFGSDLESSRQLDSTLKELSDEAEIFRIDHFLGKESVQNILALRFGNRLLEPGWNRHSISSVQIDIPETLTIEGRGSFFEGIGAFRDMVITHLSQTLGVIAMEPPQGLSADEFRDAKAAVFDAIEPLDPADVVYGQYEGYRCEDGVDENSQVETFVAARVHIDNERWRGVPFFLRTGKALASSRWMVTLTYRGPESGYFEAASQATDAQDAEPNSIGRATPAAEAADSHQPDQVVLELSESATVSLAMNLKRPGPALNLIPAQGSLSPSENERTESLSAYERILLDIFRGDQTFFTRSDEVDRLWQIATPVLENPPAPTLYPQGSWGPEQAQNLVGQQGWKVEHYD